MRRFVQLLTALACLGVASTNPVYAACGDGILQGGEACDPASPAGEVACPGRCISLPNLAACTCATLSDDPRDFAAIADIQARLAPGSSITTGGVAVVTAGGLLSVGSNVLVDFDAQAVGDRCRLLPGSGVGRLFCNTPVVLPEAFIADGGPFPFVPPVAFPTLPPFPAGFGGGSDVTITPASTEYLAPGAYGNVVVEKGGTLVLHGTSGGTGTGRFDVLAIKVIDGGRLFADNPVDVHVTNATRLTGSAALLATSGSGVQPGDIRFFIAGRGAKLGKGAFVQAHIRAPNGKITVGRATVVQGQLVAQKITIQKSGVLQAVGGCGDGTRQVGEPCDTTAANGDAACPGECIPLGEPGQCSCACTTNADCDDDNACNGVETCSSGHCVLGTPPACNDGNPCTRDCSPSIGCIQVAVDDGTPCDDGDECTNDDFCMSGACESGALRACNDGNGCTADSCDPAHGCLHEEVANGQACSDGDACTAGDACIRGDCIGGLSVSCDDANPCTADTCSPVLGCQHTPVLDGVSCAGTSPCSALDVCSAGNCVERGSDVCSDGNECTIDSCTPEPPMGGEPATFTCGHANAANFTPCGPGGALTCFNGVCL